LSTSSKTNEDGGESSDSEADDTASDSS
jgi:hypothetical protein